MACRYSCLAFFLALVAQPSIAQRQVSGTVLAENGAVLADASVVLILPNSGLQRYGTSTDSAGSFQIHAIQPGVYELVVSFVGYSSESRRLDLRTENRTRLRITLDSRVLPQKEVVITAGRVRFQLNPVTASNITAKELEQLPDMKDLPVLLSRSPSITYYSENGNGIGYSTMRMRGFGQRRLAISINGVPQNDPEEFNVFWINFFDIQGAVEDIQIQRGANSSFYGPAAIGGAINIRAMPYRAYPYFRTELGAGSFGTRRYTLEANSGLIGDEYVFFARLSRLLSDGYRDWSWTRFWRFFAGGTRYGKRSSLTFQVFGGPQRDGLAYSGIPKAANKKTIVDDFGTRIDRTYNFSSIDRDVENFHQPHVEVHHDLRLSEKIRLNQVLFWVQGKGYFDFGGTFRSADYLRLPDGFVPDDERSLPLFLSKPDVSVLFRAFLDQWQVGWMPRVTISSERTTTRIGAELRLHRSLRWGRIQAASGIPENLVGSTNDVQVYSFRGEKAIASVSGSTLYRASDRWAIQADLQLTYRAYRIYDEAFFDTRVHKPYVFVNPRIGVTYNPEKEVSGYASLALANREPRLKSLYDGEEAGAGFVPAFERNNDGSLNMDRALVGPERLIDAELGLIVNRDRYRATVNVFYMDFLNEIVPSGGLDQYGVPRTGNAERTRHAGLEMEAAVRIARGLDLGGNLTISRNRFVTFDEYIPGGESSTISVSRDGNPIAGFPDVSGNIGATLTRGSFTANMHASYVGRQYIDNSHGRSSDGSKSDGLVNDAYALVDASVHCEFPPSSPFAGLRLGLDINNILDERILMFGNVGPVGPQFFPAATRHVFVSASYTLR